MIKKTALTLMAALVLTALASPAYSQLVRQIGNELTAPNAVSSTPLYRSTATSGCYWSVSQTLYPAATLNIPPGSVINALRYHKTNNGASATPAAHTLQVYLRETTATNYTGPDTFGNILAGATPVFLSTTWEMPATIGWIDFGPFNQAPYVYMGGNLEVIVFWDCSATPNPGATTAGFNWSYESYPGTTTDSLGRGYGSTCSLPGPTTSIATSTIQGHTRYPVVQFGYSIAGDVNFVSNNSAATDLVTGPQTDYVVLDLATTTVNTSQSISSLTFAKSGTMPDASIGTIKLVHDTNDNGVVDVTDTILGQGTLTGGSITFNSGAGFPISVPTTGGPRLLLAVSSVGNWAIGDTIEFSIPSSAAITWSGGSDLSTYPVSSGVRNIIPPVLRLGNPNGTTNTIPFNSTYVRQMTVYDATEVGAMPAGSVITEIRVHGTNVSPAPTFLNMEVRIASSTATPTALVNTWDSNFNGAQTVVFSRERFVPESIPGVGANRMWRFPLDVPYTYSGTDGLNIDFAWSGRVGTGFNIIGDTTRQRIYTTISPVPATGTVTTTAGNFGIEWDFELPPVGDYQSIDNNSPFVPLFDSGTATDKVMLDLELNAVGANRNLGSLTVAKTGTVPDGAITDIRLVLDTNNNGVVDGTDTVLDSLPGLTGGQAAFTIAPALTVSTTGPSRLLVAFSTAAPLTLGQTLAFELTSGASVGWSGGNDLTGYPVTSAIATVTPPQVTVGNFGFVQAGNTIPFNSTATTSYRFMTAYSPAELSHIPAGSLINEIRVYSSTAAVGSYDNFVLRIGHTDNDPNGMTNNFDSNFAGIPTTVIQSASFTPVSTTSFYGGSLLSFQFTSPFLYNGAQGIVVDFEFTGRVGTGFNVYSMQGRQRLYSTVAPPPATGTLTSTGNFGMDFLWDPNPTGVAISNLSSGTGIPRNPLNEVILDISTIVFGPARDITQIVVTKGGTIADASISAVSLIHDVNGDGVYAAPDVILASGAFASGVATFNLAPAFTVPASSSERLLVAITSASPLAYGETISLEISSASDVAWSGSPLDLTSYPVASGTRTVSLIGTVTIAQTGPADFSDIGDAFDALEQFGVGGPVVLQIMDSATYVSTPSYSLGLDHTSTTAMQARVQGVSATNTITLRPAAGQKPVIQGNANGAVLAGTTSSSTVPLTGRGGIAIHESFVIVEGLRITGGPNFGILIQGNNSLFSAPNGFTPIDNVVRHCFVWDIPDGPGIAYMGQNSGYFTGTFENNFVWDCFTNSVPSTTVLQGITSNAGLITIRNPQNGQGIVRHNTILNTANFANVGGIGVGSASTAFALHDCNNNIIVCTNAIAPAFYATSTTHLPNPTNCNFNYWYAALQSNQVAFNTFALWTASGRDLNGSDLDPMLEDVTGPIPDLRLAAGSPCIDPSGNTSTVTTDVFGLARPVGTTNDIGAYEWRQTPEIRVLQGTTAVPNGGSYNTGVIPASPGTPVTFTISNPGQLSLSLTGTPAAAITLGANMAASTVVQTQPATTVTAAGTTTFTVNLNPIGSGPFDCTITIANNTLTRDPYVFTINGTVNSPPAITVSTSAGAVTNNGTVNVGYATSLAALGLQFTVSDPDNNNTSLAATVGNVTTQGFVTSEWESASATVPYNRTPNTGSFSVPLVNHLVTLTANDGVAQTVFSFTLAVGASTPPTIEIPGSGSIFVGTAATGFSASINPASLPANAVLELADVDGDNINVTAVVVAPSAPTGINAPGTSAGNPAGTPIAFTGDASLSEPGTYTWTITITDGLTAPVNVDVSITVLDLPANHVAGAQASSGDGSAGNPYAGEIGIGGTPSLELASVTDMNTTQTLTLVNVVAGGGNPSSIFNVGFLGVGNAGTIEAVAPGTVTVADVGAHDFVVSISDGTNVVAIAVRVTVTNTGNVQPMAGLATGSAFAGTQAAGFTLTVNPGQTLANANLTVSDADGNNITVVSVVAAPSALGGVTAPAAAAAAPGPFGLSWTGTADASETPGVYVYTVTLSDAITTPASFNVTITLADLPPEFTAGPSVSQGDGTAANPYAVSTQAGKTPTFEMALVTDPNTGQTITLANVAADPGNPTSGAGFTVTLDNGVLTLSANGKLSDASSGTYRFTATVTDGSSSVPIALQVRVAKAPKDDDDGGGCAAAGGSSGWAAMLLALLGLPLLYRRRRISA